MRIVGMVLIICGILLLLACGGFLLLGNRTIGVYYMPLDAGHKFEIWVVEPWEPPALPTLEGQII